VGCGVLGVLRLLANRVGPNGRVVGLDREARMVQSGRQFAERLGLGVEYIQADATASGLPNRSFDLTHARTLLLNVQNPQEILAEMVRITKPGGIVAVQEPDASAWTCDPPHPAFDILRAAILSAYRRTGKDFNIGRRITRMLKEAGCSDVRVRATARVTQPGDYYHTFLLTITELVREVIVQAGELTGDELDSYTQSLRRDLETPGTITCQPLILQAWGQTANP
jgi:ubiquinone/menaquinone biosynthesis C-methylase UbiE